MILARTSTWPRATARAALIAALVGSALVVINHGDHLLKEPICRRFYLKVALSFLTPFIVSLVSTFFAVRDRS